MTSTVEQTTPRPVEDAPATTSCPVCDAAAPPPFVRIPEQPVHCNLLWDSADDARRAARGDIDLAFCSSCGHVYNLAFDPEATEYGGTYENSLHHSGVFAGYAEQLVADLVDRYDVRAKNIVEIGAGQGDFLRALCAAGDNWGTGFDPSALPAEVSDARVRVVPAFYGPQFANHPADVVISRHVLEHIDRSGEFVRMLRDVVGDRASLVFFEVPNALWTLEHGGIWDIIYEHCGYFTPSSFTEVFRRAGFRTNRRAIVFGGQFLTLEAHPVDRVDPRPDDADSEVVDVATIVADFADTHASTVARWRRQLDDMSSRGQSAVVWGAGSKGVTFLNVADPAGSIAHVVDVNPRKHGRFVAGTGQPIIAPRRLAELSPDVVVVMNPNYRHEVESSLFDLGVTAQIVVPSGAERDET